MVTVCSICDKIIPFHLQRWVLVVLGLMFTLLFGGYHFGMNAIYPLYKQKGVYQDYCKDDDCAEQEKMFSRSYIVAVNVQMFIGAVPGYMIDWLGLRLTMCFGTVLCTIGTICYAYTSAEAPVLIFFAGSFMGIGSLSCLYSNHQTGRMFPKWRSIIMAVMTGAYDSSAMITFFLAVRNEPASLEYSFVTVAVLGLILGLSIAFILPIKVADVSKFAGASANQETCDFYVPKEEQAQQMVREELDRRYPSVIRSFCSLTYFLGCVLFSFQYTRYVHFMSTQATLLIYLGHESSESDMRKVLSIITGCGLIVAPVSGFVMDYCLKAARKKISEQAGKITEAQIYWYYVSGLIPALSVMCCASFVLSILVFIKNSAFTIYLSYFVSSIFRTSLFSSTAVLCMASFPAKYYGTLYGTMHVIGGIFACIQYIILEMPIATANIICLVISIAAFFPIVSIIFIAKRL